MFQHKRENSTNIHLKKSKSFQTGLQRNPINQSVSESVNQSASQLINQSINQSVNQSISQ